MSALASTAVDLARIQFATTSIYHFLFVPLTLGLGPLVAIMRTAWYRTGSDAWLRLTRFFGTLFLINFHLRPGSCSRTSSPRPATDASC
jgi:cytochrome d ubiquinol oxidase subunit I